jgi:integrase/recombinase XerC
MAAPPPDHVADFLTHLAKERDVSPHTVTAYRRDLALFVDFLGLHYGGAAWSWQGVDRLTMRAFLGHLQRQGLAKRSMARTLSAIRSFYRYLALTEVVDANPARAVGTPRTGRYLPSYLDRAQIEMLFELAAVRAMEGRLPDVRNLAMLELFYSTGMRVSEL